MKIKTSFLSILTMLPAAVWAQDTHTPDSVKQLQDQQLNEVVVTRRRAGISRMAGAQNSLRVGREELFKAACCNLGESFTTNPSVDVSYNDATTGARQIKLLGLSGTYVQMLTENLPNFRGAAAPYALGYVPGPWMKSIQVSKGASSVRNGYESVTGQINVQYLQPEDKQGATLNLYGNSNSRLELNADANLHLNKKLSSELLAHYEDTYAQHDDNHDGFLDQPDVRQYNLQNRWAYLNQSYIFHGGLGILGERRESGQTAHGGHAFANPYKINSETDRYELYMKHAFVLNRERGTNIALMAAGSIHRQTAGYGLKAYDVNQKNAYAQLLYETNFGKAHNLAAGLSFNHDHYNEQLLPVHSTTAPRIRQRDTENISGIYAQYTYNLHERLVAMAGLRADHSNRYGTFLTPRLHIKWQLGSNLSLRASVGKGYRTAHPLAENHYLLASGRQLVVESLHQEEAWNYGGSLSYNLPLAGKLLKLNAEYYYTHFMQQAVIDYDTDPQQIRIGNLAGRSFSHTFQVDASYELLKGLELTAAYRRNIVKTTYGGALLEKPLTNSYKGLLTASYKTPLALWQFDATLQLNGGGRMTAPYTPASGQPSWSPRFHAFGQLNMQVTRWFRTFSVYAGGENLTGFKQRTPIIGADNPWAASFEPTLIWGPVHGAVLYAGIRFNIGRQSY